MTIRPIQDNEIDFLADMLYEAIFVPEGQEPLPKEIIKDKSLSKYYENWGKDRFDIALVTILGQELIGAAWGRLLTEKNRGFGYVNDDTPEISIAIKPKYRNKGIGTQLMSAIEQSYKTISVPYLSLSVDKANMASKLYLRLGYNVVHETETSWTMTKLL